MVTSRNEWEEFYISDVKDFHTAGKVLSSLGIPMFILPNHSKYIMPDGSEVEVSKQRYEKALENIESFVEKIS